MHVLRKAVCVWRPQNIMLILLEEKTATMCLMTTLVFVSRKHLVSFDETNDLLRFYLFLRQIMTKDQTDRWGHSSMAPYGGKRVTPAEVV